MLARAALLVVALAAAAPAAERSYEDWSSQVDRVLEELRQSRSLKDRVAFQDELGKLVREPVSPPDERVKKLEALLPLAPEGPMLDGVAEALLALRSPAALSVILAALERSDWVNLQGRELGENGRETRWRVLEYHVTCAADAAAAAVARGGSPPEVSPEVRALLVGELTSKAPRRVRAAALLLGGWGVKDAAGELAAALGRHEDPQEEGRWTRALLLEALGRTDPVQAGPQVLASAGSSDVGERLAAIPVLGHLAGREADKALGRALEDKRWFVVRAAIEACTRRRTAEATGLLVARLPKASPRIERELMRALVDLSGGEVPGDPAHVAGWWAARQAGFQPAAPGAPPRAAAAGATRTRKAPSYFSSTVDSDRVCVVFDTSGSMAEGAIRVAPPEGEKGEASSGTPFQVTLRQIGGLLAGFKGEFNLIAYSDAVTPFQSKLVAAAKGKLKEADKFLGGLKPAGETNIYDALTLALSDPEVDTIYFLSDGAPNRGARVTPTEILEGIERANRFRRVVIHTIQIGQDQELMQRLAARNGGTYRLVE